MTVMRHAAIVVCLFALPACDPGIKSFDVAPAQLQCPGSVTLSWDAQGDGLHLDADQPVTPSLPVTVPGEIANAVSRMQS